MRIITALCLLVLFISCKKESTTEDNNDPAITHHVFVLGTTSDSLVLWKDDTLNFLHSNYFPQSYSMPGQIIESGQDIYIAGGSEDEKAVYYKNGVKTTLAQYYSYASSISVYNNHVYVAGFSMDNNGTNYGETYTTYWEDGVRHTSYGVNTQYDYVLRQDNDLYLSGFENASGYGYAAMIFLKNNVSQTLSGFVSEGRKIIVKGGDVYVAGNIYLNAWESYATLWKNGQETHLNNLMAHSSANSIFIDGNDVYVAGSIANNAVYWKNGVENVLDFNNASAWDIKVVDGDVYVVGQYYNALTNHFVGALWKNGVKQDITTPDHESYAFSILVK